MELPKGLASALSSIRIGELKGRPKSLAVEIAADFSEEYNISLQEHDSLFSLVQLSNRLNKKTRKDKQLLKKMEELVFMCNKLEHGKVPVAVERQEQQKPRAAFERGRKDVELDKLAGQKAEAAGGKKGEEKKGAHSWKAYLFDNDAIASGNKEERKKLAEAVGFLLEYFPPEERVPPDLFFEAAERSAAKTLGNSTRNGYAFHMVEDGGKIIAASSVFYLDNPKAVFVGFIRVAEPYQRKGVSSALQKAVLAFGVESARAAGGRLLASVGEMESIPLSPNKEDAGKRYKWAMTLGTRIADPTGGFSYTQSGLPLNIVYTPISDPSKDHLTNKELKALVEAIYYTVYGHLFRVDPKANPASEMRKIESARKSLDRILASIPEKGVRLVSDMMTYGSHVPEQKQGS